MKLFIVSKILFTVLVFPVIAIAQNESDAVAKIGSDIITVEQFQNRFDFMPHLNYSNSNVDSIKKEFLYSLVAEKLWAFEADQLEIDTNETVKLSLKSLEKLFVKDELYKREVESKIVVTASEIKIGLTHVTRILNALIISSPDSGKVWKLYNFFQAGASFDSVLVSMRMPQKPFEVKYGSLEDEAMEEILYSLNLNEISKPVNAKDNWFIFKLVDDEQDLSIDPAKEHARNIVIKKLKDRKSQKLGRTYLDKILSGKSIIADRQLFDIMSDKLLDILKKITAKTEIDSIGGVDLLETDVKKVLSSFTTSELNEAFVKFDSNPASIKDFLYYMIYQKVFFDSFNPNKFKQSLNRIVKKYIEDELISREGFKLGLDKLTSVKNDLQIWKIYYLSEILMNSYADSITITDEEMKNFISEEKDLPGSSQVNIREILIENIDDAEKIIKELNDGKDFELLAEFFNQRVWTKQSNGEWGFFNPVKAGEIGRIAASMDIGQIYGPIKVNEGYSIFKLIDKKNQIGFQSTVLDKDSLKLIRVKLALSKMDNLINDKTISLAKKYKISFNEQLLKNIKTSEINTFTYRFIGFGGKIAAFPITIPMYEWYKEYKLNNEFP